MDTCESCTDIQIFCIAFIERNDLGDITQNIGVDCLLDYCVYTTVRHLYFAFLFCIFNKYFQKVFIRKPYYTTIISLWRLFMLAIFERYCIQIVNPGGDKTFFIFKYYKKEVNVICTFDYFICHPRTDIFM